MDATRRLLLLFAFVLPLCGADLPQFEAYYRKSIADWEVPGIAVAIVRDGKVELAKGYGVREAGRNDPVTENTLFAIASNSKAFTSAALAILAEQKKLNWDDRVQKYLPWYSAFGDPWISQEVRIDDLLCHRIGFRTYSGDLIWWNTAYPAGEVVKRSRFLKPQFGFRRGYGYSNISFIAAGEIIAQVSGQTYVDFVRSQLLQPLGLTNTALRVEELKSRPDVAIPHGNDEEGKPYPIPWQAWDSTVAAGGVISSSADLARWLLLQLGEGKHDDRTFWSPAQTRKMWSLHTPLPAGGRALEQSEISLAGAGLGWFVADYRGEFIVRHGGAYDGMFSHTVMAPKKKIGVVVLSNSMTGLPQALAFYTLDALLEKEQRDWSAEALAREKEERAKKKKEKETGEAKRLAATKPSLPLEKYTGRYGGEMYGDANVAWENGKLMLRFLPNPELAGELVHWQHDVFEIRWSSKFAWFGNGKVQFFLNRQSEPVEFKMDVPNEDFWFDELEFKKR